MKKGIKECSNKEAHFLPSYNSKGPTDRDPYLGTIVEDTGSGSLNFPGD